MRLVLLAILGYLPASESRAFVKAKPMPLCEILGHAKEHVGEHMAVRGTIQQLEHGVYLVADSPCDREDAGIRIQGTGQAEYRAAGGTKGNGVPATVEGALVVSNNGVPEVIKAPYLVFSATRVRYQPAKRNSK